jgi:hypothetical protein
MYAIKAKYLLLKVGSLVSFILQSLNFLYCRLHRIWRIRNALGGKTRQEEVQEALKEGQGQGRFHLRMILNISY